MPELSAWVFWWLLLSWGVTATVTDSHLLAWLRRACRDIPLVGAFVRCYQCVGWWAGLGVALGSDVAWPSALLLAFVASGVCYLLGAYVRGMLGPISDG
tara:strand:- start:1608 stop:1904 length:297 start_codon:yes stop_codon:yes gene_type:complete